MGTYKVIQDIESEDKLLGPFSLRQFIYLIIVIVCLLVGFKLATVKWFLAVPFLPFIAFFGLLAAPFGHDQSSEVWLLAKIRFMFKPRKRIWNQTGIKDLVTITVPKKVERQLTKGFTQDEVRNRLSALANTVDTRGWAVKNVDANLFQQKSDRLVEGTVNLSTNQDDEIQTEFDILDYYDNPTVQHVDQLINSTEQLRHQQLVAMMQQNRDQTQAAIQQPPATDQQWFANQPQTVAPQVPPEVAANQQYIQQQVQAPAIPVANALQQVATQTQEAIQTLNIQQPTTPAPTEPAAQPMPIDQSVTSPLQEATTLVPEAQTNPQVNANASTMTTPTDPGIIELAHNDDLDIATIARQADKVVEQNNDGEVVVSLH